MSMFIIKKIISSFLYPFPVVILILLVGLFFLWFTKKQKIGKLIVSLGVILLFIFGSKTISNIIVIPFEGIYPKYERKEGQVDYIVVLGGGYGYDKQLPIVSRLSIASLFRLTEGIAVYKENPGSKLIFTGYGGIKQKKSIAEGMGEAAIALGVQKEDVVLVTTPKDTREEAVAVKPIVMDKTFVLVTSALHMKRAMLLFKKMNMNPIPAPTGFCVERIDHRMIGLPSPGNFVKIHAAVHEYLGILWGKLMGYL